MNHEARDADVRIWQVETPTRGRVLVRTPPAGPDGLLVGFHGYGEHAAMQLDRLSAIPGGDRWMLVSVQALNRFYRGRSQDTVASWMTREDREYAIAANVAYVDRVLARVRKECDNRVAEGDKGDSPLKAPVPLILAGFSQGAAMAFRAAVRGSHTVTGVIAVGGDVPPELLADPAARFPPVLLIRGERDEWYSQAKLDADVAALEARGVSVSRLVVGGGHDWTPDVSAAAARFIGNAEGRTLKANAEG